jgi:hypothetical protein
MIVFMGNSFQREVRDPCGPCMTSYHIKSALSMKMQGREQMLMEAVKRERHRSCEGQGREKKTANPQSHGFAETVYRAA